MNATSTLPAAASPSDTPPPRSSILHMWWLAARPKTLPAAIAPVLAGTAVAIHERGFHWLSALLALITALLLQIAANFANDALDFKRGADTNERTGPTRITASGMVTAEAVLRATAVTLGLAVVSGLYLVCRGGWPFLILGIAAIICAVAYTGGPFPLGYLGLGEVFVFIFFGPVAVAGTAYVQTRDLTALALATSVPIGAMAIGILIVNNLRDLPTDVKAGKHTIAVRIGVRNTQIEYSAMLIITAIMPIIFWTIGWLNLWWILTVLSWPALFMLWKQIRTRTGQALNPTLGNTGKALLLFSVLFSIALILSR
ncbi:MAG: 1,4-dihydroxy-2-naphthoate polyprenyltransferase [Thermomicrobiales bacterium]